MTKRPEPPADFTRHWEEAGALPQKRILRLALLRNLARELHAESSRTMALGLDFDPWLGQRLDRLKTAAFAPALLDGTWRDLLAPPVPFGNETLDSVPAPSAAALARFRRDQLVRPDRAWEARIIQAALDGGWSFWALHAWVDVHCVQEHSQALEAQLFPNAIVLWTESGGAPEQSFRKLEERNYWHGRWFTATRGDWHESDLAPRLPPAFSPFSDALPGWNRLSSAE